MYTRICMNYMINELIFDICYKSMYLDTKPVNRVCAAQNRTNSTVGHQPAGCAWACHMRTQQTNSNCLHGFVRHCMPTATAQNKGGVLEKSTLAAASIISEARASCW